MAAYPDGFVGASEMGPEVNQRALQSLTQKLAVLHWRLEAWRSLRTLRREHEGNYCFGWSVRRG